MEEIKNAFNNFDRKGQKFIKFEEIGSAMRELGYVPNPNELNDQIRDIEKKKRRHNCDYESF